MDLIQQVKNFEATKEHVCCRKVPFAAESCSVLQHKAALQALSNQKQPSYASTLRLVNHRCTKFPLQPPSNMHLAPGYIRNEMGGFFTS
ncbi:hypothetical protein WJX84_010101 [Apatococcus fuscideae]|uniref:Uncharacterized protein n=1 Tax=Apatococcus fuscideae TaxID=2026836 RepID=A0AAW1TKI8_9CHLO